MSSSDTTQSKILRRGVLSLLVSGTTVIIAGCTGEAKKDRIRRLDQSKNVLKTPSDITYTVLTNSTEIYDTVLWESNGTIDIKAESCIEFVSTSN